MESWHGSGAVGGISTPGLVPGEPAVGPGVFEESGPLVDAGEDWASPVGGIGARTEGLPLDRWLTDAEGCTPESSFAGLAADCTLESSPEEPVSFIILVAAPARGGIGDFDRRFVFAPFNAMFGSPSCP